jgi:hypothetical protein
VVAGSRKGAPWFRVQRANARRAQAGRAQAGCRPREASEPGSSRSLPRPRSTRRGLFRWRCSGETARPAR